MLSDVKAKYQYSKTPPYAVSVLRCSIRIPLNRTLYGYLLYVCANETAMHQPKAVHYITTVYSMYIFHHSLVSLSRIEIPYEFFEVAMYLLKYMLSCLV